MEEVEGSPTHPASSFAPGEEQAECTQELSKEANTPESEAAGFDRHALSFSPTAANEKDEVKNAKPGESSSDEIKLPLQKASSEATILASDSRKISLRDVLASPNSQLKERYLSQIEGSNETKLKYLRAQEPLLVLEFTSQGRGVFHELKRDELLAAARRAIPRNALVEPKKKEKFIGTLRHRDVRLLESNFAHSKDPAIVVRRHALIIVLPPIRMLILHDRAFLLVPDGADSMLSTFMQKMRYEEADPAEEEAFEVTALESGFIVVSHELEKELNKVRPKVAGMLKNVKSINAVSLNKIREVKADVLMLQTRLKAIQHAFTEAMSSDRDMALMNLAKVQKDPQHYRDENEDEWEADHEEMELLLENYLQLVDGIHAGAEILDQKVEAAMSVLMIRLDSARNNLLKIELMVASVTSAAAIGALIAGIFGMNLDSDVQDSPNLFWPVAGTLIFGSMLSVVCFFCYVQRSGWLIT